MTPGGSDTVACLAAVGVQQAVAGLVEAGIDDNGEPWNRPADNASVSTTSAGGVSCGPAGSVRIARARGALGVQEWPAAYTTVSPSGPSAAADHRTGRSAFGVIWRLRARRERLTFQEVRLGRRHGLQREERFLVCATSRAPTRCRRPRVHQLRRSTARGGRATYKSRFLPSRFVDSNATRPPRDMDGAPLRDLPSVSSVIAPVAVS